MMPIQLPFPIGKRVGSPLPQPSRQLVRLPSSDHIAWSELGDPTGEVVVAIHGFRGSDMGLMAVLESNCEYRIVSPNMPGMGVSPIQESRNYDLVTLAQIVIDFIELLEAGPVLLLGHSFGTVVVSAVAAARPDLIRGLLLVAPIVDPVREKSLFSALGADVMNWFYQAVLHAPRQLGQSIIDSKFPGDQSLPFMKKRKGTWQQIQQLSHEELPESFDRRAVLAAHKASTSHGCREFAAKISQVPMQVIVGGADQFSSVAATRSLAREAGGAALRVVDGAGHLMHYEDVAEVKELITSALQELASR
ncbi:MAG: alpha/beta fold hydrolase [Propionibacteriaceae bacterium]